MLDRRRPYCAMRIVTIPSPSPGVGRRHNSHSTEQVSIMITVCGMCLVRISCRTGLDAQSSTFNAAAHWQGGRDGPARRDVDKR